MIPIAIMVAGNSTAHVLAPSQSETFRTINKATINIPPRKGAFILHARAQMCGSRWRGQEPSAKYFALDPSERLTVELIPLNLLS
jgi:hypothetical protein